MSWTIEITDEASPAIRAAMELPHSGLFQDVMARVGENFLRDWFIALDAQRPNALGGDRTHFYSSTGQGVTSERIPDGVRFSINQLGIRQRYQGGVIEPTGGKRYLTIPAIAEAYGRRAGEFSNLRLVFRRRDGQVRAVALEEAPATEVNLGKRGQRKKDNSDVYSFAQKTGGRIYFWLVPRVVQQPDPSVMPSEADFAEAVLAGAEPYAQYLISGPTQVRNN